MAQRIARSLFRTINVSNRLLANKSLTLTSRVPTVCVTTQADELPPSFSNHFKLERLWTVGMIPLFPAALFFHNPVMDFLLATAITLHCYWGFDTVMADYMTPLGLGPALKTAAPYFIMAVALVMYVGLLHFNYSDVGITKAFEMIWSL